MEALRRAACDDLVLRLAALAAADPPLDLRSHPKTRLLLDEPSPVAQVAYKHREDLIDAALCAWTAAYWWRYGLSRCQVLGLDEDGGDGVGRDGLVERISFIFQQPSCQAGLPNCPQDGPTTNPHRTITWSVQYSHLGDDQPITAPATATSRSK